MPTGHGVIDKVVVVVVVEITSPQQDQLMKVPLLCEIICQYGPPFINGKTKYSISWGALLFLK